MANSRRKKFKKFMKAVDNAGRKCFPEDSHEAKFIAEGIALMEDMMNGTPAFDEKKETMDDAVAKQCADFINRLDAVGIKAVVTIVERS